MRDAGQPNVISDFLAGTENENMPTSDFMFYYADIFVINVQYGHRVALCDAVINLKD